MNTVTYEWDIETLDSAGDIIDHDHIDKLTPFFLQGLILPGTRLVLVRDVGNNIDGVVHRAWAITVNNMYLPESFDDDLNAVPQRFHKELARFRRSGELLQIALHREAGEV